MKISRIRKYFLLVFSTIVFVALAATALILARGNIFTDQGLVETGSLRFSVNPSGDYQVFLNEQEQKLSNNSISNVKPGTYELRVQKANFSIWHQSVDIKAGRVTDVTVQLFPQALKLEQLSKTNLDRVFFSPSHRYVYYSITNYPLGSSVGIWKQTLQQSNIPLIEEKPFKITNLVSLIEKDINGGTFSIIPASDDSKILLKTSSGIYILDTSRYNEPDATTKLDLTYPIDEIGWLRASTNLYIRSGKLLIDYDIDKKSSTIITYATETTPIYTATSDAIIYIQGKKLFRYTPGSNTETKLENVVLPEGITDIQAGTASDTNLVVKVGNKVYYLNAQESYLTELGDYQVLTISPNGRNLVVNDGQKVESIEVDISLVLNTVTTTKRATGISEDIARSSIIWDSNSNYFVFQNTKELTKIYSADSSGNNVNLLLLSESLTAPVTYGLPENNLGLIVKLLDNNDAATTDQRSNIYRLGFTQ